MRVKLKISHSFKMGVYFKFNGNKLSEYSQNARKLAEEKFDRDILANKFVELIEKYSK